MNTDLREANVRLVQNYLNALNAWDLDAIREMSTADVVFEVPFRLEGFERYTRGRETYIDLLRQASTVMIDGSENLHDIRIDTLWSDPNELYAEYKSAMKLRSGASYGNEYIARFSVRHGQIVRFAEYLNPIALYVAMGGQIGSIASVENSSLLPPLLNAPTSSE